MALVQKEVQKIYMWKEPYTDYSAIQGPCPTGFHVPTKDEWINVYNVGVSLGIWSTSNGSYTSQYLKLPMAGYRDANGSATYQSSYGFYLTCTQYTSADYSYILYLRAGNTSYAPTSNAKVIGASIRPFKDTVVNPIENSSLKSGWTWIYQSGSNMYGLAWNSTEGLISLSSNGTTWYTIADKNLGATSVWSSGTLTQANCGYYYQWGNNYGFAWTGSITTASGQVNASTYGPGNYYNSSTYRIGVTSWDSSNNANLRGGVTGVITGGGDIEAKKVYMWKEPYTDYSAMQGPCPNGFHVPTKAQWEEVYNAWTTLGGGNKDATNFGIALKLPFAGYRDYDTTVRVVGSTGHYWTCEANSNSPTVSYALDFSSSGSGSIYTGSSYYRAPANSIRAFKDISVEPTGSWTKMYGTSIESGGIFWDSVNGLISISGDGSNWITIADKNMGATTVWSGGDTLTDANCGYFYQWGNNYGFPHSGNVTISYTKVDASNYGPGNYYSDSTFRYINSEPNNWDSSNNLDIWGGVTGPTTLGGDILIRPALKYVDFLLVGGGGGGGYSASNCQYKPGAGGGGGGAIYCEGYAISSGEYCITIGAGGYRDNGTSSIFGDFEATGGCCGRTNGTAGCSGYVTYKGDTIVNYTSGGGRWTNGSLWSAGGGGGIGGNGCPGVSYYVGGAGGLGCLANTSWGEVLCVGGGGGGYGYGGSGAGCYGGGSGSSNGGDATSYTGGGGGGAYRCSNSGGIGAGGVFYLGYPSSCGYLVTGGNCCYECNGYCIHKFTSNGTLTVN